MPPGAKLEHVELFHAQYRLSRPPGRNLTADEATALVVEPGCEVLGEVVDERGRPVARALVQVRWHGERRSRHAAFTGPDGRYHFGDVEADRWDLLVEPEGLAPKVVVVVADPGRPAVNQVVVEAGGSLGGIVVDAAGKPVAGASVGWIVLVDRSGVVQKSSTLGRITNTDADGRFRVDALPPGEVQVTAMESQGEGKAEVVLPVNRSDHVIKLAR